MEPGKPSAPFGRHSVGITSSTALWYASRATGVVALVLLTVVVVLGILVNRRGQLPGLPRFATTSLHRSMSLAGCRLHRGARGHRDRRPLCHDRHRRHAHPVRLALQAAMDRPRRGIAGHHRGADHHQPGQGAGSAAAPGARCTGSRTLSWPVALLHGIGSSTDLRGGSLLALTIVCIAAVVGATGWRIAARGGRAGAIAAGDARAWPRRDARHAGQVTDGRPLTGAGAR